MQASNPAAPNQHPPQAAIPEWLFAAVLSTSPDHFYLYDLEGRYQYVNAAALAALGLELKDMLGKTWQELGFPAEIMEPFDVLRRKVMATGSPLKGETHFPTTRGTRLFDYHVSPIYASDGTLVGTSSTARDLPPANRQLRESEDRFKGAFQVSGIGMALVALDGRLIKVNPAFCGIVGYTEAELAGMTFQDITHPDDLASDLEEYARLQRGESASYQMLKRYIHRSGSVRRARLTVSLVRDEHGGPLYAFSQVEDVTQQHAAEAELALRQRELEAANQSLLEADRFKDEFISVVAHELKSPLTILKGFSVLLENQSLGPLNDDQHRAMQQVRSGTEMLIQLVNDLLDMSTMQAGHFTLHVEPVAFDSLVERTLGLLALKAAHKDLHIAVEVAAALPKVALDEKRIGQVLHNLIHNAIKFTPPSGCISVKAQATAGGLRCDVQDSGPGISAEDMPRLFKRFSQLPGPHQGVSGSGLGLSISKALVEAHGGAMGVESEGPGKGSTFWFTLPL